MNKEQKTAALAIGATVAIITALTLMTTGDDSDEQATAREQRTTRIAASTTPTPTPSPTGPLMYALKDTAKWDGISVKLSNFQRGRTGKAGVPEETNYVRFTITATNDSAEPFNLSDLFMRCTTEEVFDGTDSLMGSPDVHVLKDKSVTWDAACAQVKDEEYFQVEISPQYDENRTAIFAGTVDKQTS